MSIASLRESRIIKSGSPQSFAFGDMSNGMLVRNKTGGAEVFLSSSNTADPDALVSDGDTQRIPAGAYAYIPPGVVGPRTVQLAVNARTIRRARVQVIELGPTTNVDPGATGGLRDTLELRPFSLSPRTTIVGTGAGPLLVSNESRVSVFLTINSGTDPDVSGESSDPNTFELEGHDFLVLPASGTGYEVRAQLSLYGVKSASLQLTEVV